MKHFIELLSGRIAIIEFYTVAPVSKALQSTVYNSIDLSIIDAWANHQELANTKIDVQFKLVDITIIAAGCSTTDARHWIQKINATEFNQIANAVDSMRKTTGENKATLQWCYDNPDDVEWLK